MIVDTSAWVEYLRATGSPTHLALRSSVRGGKPISTPAPVVTELLSGGSSEVEVTGLLQLLSRFEILIPDSLRDFQGAARIYRVCRRAGFTIRSTVDCMVAATALTVGRPLLALNRDFAVIARHTELELVVPPEVGVRKKPPRGWSAERADDDPRAGWAEAARVSESRGEGGLLDEPVPTAFDESEWEWE